MSFNARLTTEELRALLMFRMAQQMEAAGGGGGGAAAAVGALNGRQVARAEKSEQATLFIALFTAKIQNKEVPKETQAQLQALKEKMAKLTDAEKVLDLSRIEFRIYCPDMNAIDKKFPAVMAKIIAEDFPQLKTFVTPFKTECRQSNSQSFAASGGSCVQAMIKKSLPKESPCKVQDDRYTRRADEVVTITVE